MGGNCTDAFACIHFYYKVIGTTAFVEQWVPYGIVEEGVMKYELGLFYVPVYQYVRMRLRVIIKRKNLTIIMLCR